MSLAPAFLTLDQPSGDEQMMLRSMSARLAAYAPANREAEQYYEGSHVAQQFGISIPPSMRNVSTVSGWCGTVVDVLEERLDWLGYMIDTPEADPLGLDEMYRQNMLDVDSGLAHLDSLIFGVSFLSVGSGMEGEPGPLVTPHAPSTMTAVWDRRTRRLSSAYSEVQENGSPVEATLYLPDVTVTFERSPTGGPWRVVDRDEHNLGRVPIVMMPNRVRGSRAYGRSEISRKARYLSDAAQRTLLGLEVNREFYNAPQRVGLNIAEGAFTDATGKAVSQWTSIQGRVWMVPPNEDGQAPPDVKQFSASSPAPYLDTIRGYAQQIAEDAGMPAAYLGFATDNPASADAIRAGEARLVKRAERRQAVFGRAWLEVARLGLLVRDGVVPDVFDLVSVRWRDAATPTRAAAADEAAKLIGSGVLPADSQVTYDRVGLSPAEQRQVDSDKRRTAGRGVLDGLRAQVAAVVPPMMTDASNSG